MNTQDNGGSAFPKSHSANYPEEIVGGMSLRDYFAAKAMQGFNKGMVDYGWDHEILEAHAKQAYAIADAMLKARNN